MTNKTLQWEVDVIKKFCAVILTAVVVTGMVQAEESSKESRPNVILILSDDMGYSDLPKFGTSEIPTPNIDRLADEGTLFTDAYVTAPICVASRMGLMTGQYQQRFGIYDNIYGEERTRLFLRQTLMPAVFQNAGYVDFGFMGSKEIRTPYLDKLAQQSVRFTQAYAGPTCSPSR